MKQDAETPGRWDAKRGAACLSFVPACLSAFVPASDLNPEPRTLPALYPYSSSAFGLYWLAICCWTCGGTGS